MRSSVPQVYDSALKFGAVEIEVTNMSAETGSSAFVVPCNVKSRIYGEAGSNGKRAKSEA